MDVSKNNVPKSSTSTSGSRSSPDKTKRQPIWNRSSKQGGPGTSDTNSQIVTVQVNPDPVNPSSPVLQSLSSSLLAVADESRLDSEIIEFNVGGTKISTTRQTLTLIPDTFFTSLISGSIPTLKDSSGLIFIDRDPRLFNVILNFLRTKQLPTNITISDLDLLIHEAEFYSISPLVKKLQLAAELISNNTCGGVIFQAHLKTSTSNSLKSSLGNHKSSPGRNKSLTDPGNSSVGIVNPIITDPNPVIQIAAHHNAIAVAHSHYITCYRLKDAFGWQKIFDSEKIPNKIISQIALCYNCNVQVTSNPVNNAINNPGANNQASSVTNHGARFMIALAFQKDSYVRLWSVNVTSLTGMNDFESSKVEIGKFHLNSSSVDALFFIGSQLIALGFESARVGIWHATSTHWLVQGLGQRGNNSSSNHRNQAGQSANQSSNQSGSSAQSSNPGSSNSQSASSNNHLGSSSTSANVSPGAQSCSITSYDKAGCNFLLLGSKNGSIYLIDMQKFPLRIKDGDLLINELYQDPDLDEITAISCYLTRTPKTNGNWIEIAYGTKSGIVRVLVQHPETVGHGPQLFLTFKVHFGLINSVMLSERFLISTCDHNHVRTWTLTRFRGRISTQPGSTPHASFRILNSMENHIDCGASTSSGKSKSSFLPAGPFGDQDDGDKQIFVERFRPITDHVTVTNASNGIRICNLKSIDKSNITCYTVHECEAIAMGNRSRRYILTGHSNGHVQVWDLTTGFEMLNQTQNYTSSNVTSSSCSCNPTTQQLTNSPNPVSGFIANNSLSLNQIMKELTL